MVVQIESDSEADSAVTNGIFPPVFDGLVGYWEHQGTLDRARLNLVDGSMAAVTGAPTMSSDGMTTTGIRHFLTTALAETDALTFLSAAQILDDTSSSASGQTMLVSNFRSTVGSSLYVRNGTNPPPGGRLSANSIGGGGVVDIQQTNVTGWRLRMVRAAPDVLTNVQDMTAGQSASAAGPTSARTLNTPDLIRIGSSYSGSFTGRAKHLRTAIYNRRLTDTELATMRTWLQAQVALVDPAIVI